MKTTCCEVRYHDPPSSLLGLNIVLNTLISKTFPSKWETKFRTHRS